MNSLGVTSDLVVVTSDSEVVNTVSVVDGADSVVVSLLISVVDVASVYVTDKVLRTKQILIPVLRNLEVITAQLAIICKDIFSSAIYQHKNFKYHFELWSTSTLDSIDG